MRERVVKVERVVGFRRAASQVALKRDATAPTALGTDEADESEQV